MAAVLSGGDAAAACDGGVDGGDVSSIGRADADADDVDRRYLDGA